MSGGHGVPQGYTAFREKVGKHQSHFQNGCDVFRSSPERLVVVTETIMKKSFIPACAGMRNKFGQFRKSKIMYGIVGFSAFVVIAVAVFAESSAQVVEAVDVRDNIEKLTDNLAEQMRVEQETKATLERAAKAYDEAEALHNGAVDEVNKAIDFINTYQKGV